MDIKSPTARTETVMVGVLSSNVREDIPSGKLDQFKLGDDIEGIFIEILENLNG